MKKQLSIIAFTIILFAAVLGIMSCSGTPPTNNTANSNTNAESNTALVKSALVEDCVPSGTTTIPIKIREGVERNIGRDQNLSKQYGTVRKNFEFQPVMESGEAVLYIWGKVFVKNPSLDGLNQTFKFFMKQGCVNRIVFGQPPSPPTITVTARDFTYEACEAPNDICADGSCQLPANCPHFDANSNTNKNSNTNSNTNKNSNTNSNSNTNTNSNTNKKN